MFSHKHLIVRDIVRTMGRGSLPRFLRKIFARNEKISPGGRRPV